MVTEIPASLIEIEGPLRKATDDVLTLAAKSGNGSAFVGLSRRHSKRIQLRIYRTLGDWEDAKDALQDSLFKAFKHLSAFRGACRFSSWLTKIAINSALMLLRKKKAHPETSYDRTTGSTETLEFWDCADLSAYPDRLFAGRETDELLRSAILRLPWCYRSVVELFYTEGCSTIETAHAMGISVAAAKSRLLRARLRLRESLPRRTLEFRNQRMLRPCLRTSEIPKRRWTQGLGMTINRVHTRRPLLVVVQAIFLDWCSLGPGEDRRELGAWFATHH